MTRKLVTVRRVSSLTPIPGVTYVHVAAIDGWTAVVSKSSFTRPGQLGVFFEPDSILPASDKRWAADFGTGYKFYNESPVRGHRVKTTTTRGYLNEGLLRPLSLFPEIKEVIDTLIKKYGEKEAEEVWREMSFDEFLGVTKYHFAAASDDETEQQSGSSKKKTVVSPEYIGPYPSFVPKTEQERIQNLGSIFSTRGDAVFQESTKMDGQSMTVYFLRTDDPCDVTLPPVTPQSAAYQPNGRVGVCSRNYDLSPISQSLLWTVANNLGLPAKLSQLNRSIALQGELCGDKVQRNAEGFAKGYNDFFLFSIYDIDEGRYLDPKIVEEEWTVKLGVRHVPVNGYFKLEEIAASAREVLKRAQGVGINGKPREGVVLKELGQNGWMGAASFKAIAAQYLLLEDAVDKKKADVDELIGMTAEEMKRMDLGKGKVSGKRT